MTDQPDIPEHLSIEIRRSLDRQMWEIDLCVDGHHFRVRAKSIHRAVTLALFDARLVCKKHFRAAMAACKEA